MAGRAYREMRRRTRFEFAGHGRPSQCVVVGFAPCRITLRDLQSWSGWVRTAPVWTFWFFHQAAARTDRDAAVACAERGGEKPLRFQVSVLYTTGHGYGEPEDPDSAEGIRSSADRPVGQRNRRDGQAHRRHGAR